MLKVQHTLSRGYGVFATEDIPCNKYLLPFTGREVDLVIAPPVALQVSSTTAILPDMQNFLRFLNHSCEPNCSIVPYKHKFFLFSLRYIAYGTELTFNYNTTEWDLIQGHCDFECHCGENNCLQRIRGFRYLTDEQKDSILPICLEYLKRMKDDKLTPVPLTIVKIVEKVIEATKQTVKDSGACSPEKITWHEASRDGISKAWMWRTECNRFQILKGSGTDQPFFIAMYRDHVLNWTYLKNKGYEYYESFRTLKEAIDALESRVFEEHHIIESNCHVVVANAQELGITS